MLPLLVIVGCSGDAASGDDDDVCTGLGKLDCQVNPTCIFDEVYRYDPNTGRADETDLPRAICYERALAACPDSPCPFGPAETGECFLFSSGCKPPGWVPCELSIETCPE